MNKKAMFMETTSIKPEKTLGEIQGELVDYGAESFFIDYINKEINSIQFKYNGIAYKLPCRWQALEKRLMEKNGRLKDEYQPMRVALRQILRWVQAQCALIETNMVTIEEVFLPYAFTGKETFYELVKNNPTMLTHKK